MRAQKKGLPLLYMFLPVLQYRIYGLSGVSRFVSWLGVAASPLTLLGISSIQPILGPGLGQIGIDTAAHLARFTAAWLFFAAPGVPSRSLIQ